MRKQPKTLKEIETVLKENKPILKEKFKVKEIGVFGSYARGEESKKSDIDILVEFYEPVGWEFIDLKEYLESILGKEIDLVTRGALKPQLKAGILKEVVYA
ncbi:MAG: nucleotidyltransferase family protein [Nanoarchaeota archaeon]|nr:nucleotidyltransferase family protein [Nanoarchaeota archaeon]